MLFSEALRHLREKKLVTQEQIAESIKVSPSTINRWERGKSIPNISIMRNIKKYCESNNIPDQEIQDSWMNSRFSNRKTLSNKDTQEVLRVFEGFAGYGGATFGLKRAGIEFETVGYSEFDRFASDLYDANHKDKNGNLIKNWGDITKIKPEELPDFDLFTGGFPCQPFSQVGMQQGESDQYGRGTLMYDIIRICACKKPKYIFLENVKGLSTKRFEKTFSTLKEALKKLGYGDLKYAVLNTKDYGVPQNRERLWMFARLGGLPENFSMVPPMVINNLKLRDFVDKNPDPSLYLSQQQIKRIKEFYGIPSFIVSDYSCFDLYNKNIRNDGLSITILAPEHNKMRMVEPTLPDGTEIVRKYSVTEQFRLMGFKDGEIDFAGQSYSQLSKRAANGWDVNLVGLLIKHIWRQLNEN